ncbi:MAG: hypothetical protein JWN70_1470, partial [Planctomycetaceae bacterium]|nr:hypothetical protein [Planctomycetaceae bacterium]
FTMPFKDESIDVAPRAEATFSLFVIFGELLLMRTSLPIVRSTTLWNTSSLVAALLRGSKRAARSRTWLRSPEILEPRIVLTVGCECGCGDDPVIFSTAAVGANSVHVGSSPFAPPEDDNSVFVVDEGTYLDTGCTFNTDVPDGKLVITLPIDRYIGDVDKLHAAGLLPDTVELQLPAFDVDIDGGDAGELDRVYFNGHVVSEEFLTGQNETWKLNTFRIPIDWLNLPSDPGDGGTLTPADNTIEIQIDVLDEGWCTSVDWAALTIDAPNPVFFVHGILSDSSGWGDVWEPGLQNLGVPVGDISLGGTFGVALDSIGNNAEKIATKISSLQARWGFDNITFVTHSKGGLDSRQFIEDLLYDDDPDDDDLVSALFQIGTPNAGSPLADTLEAGLLEFSASFGVVGLAIDGLLHAFVTPAGVQLTTAYMEGYNAIHSFNPNTSYYSLAGDYDPSSVSEDPLGVFLDALLPGADDSVVPESSVWALDYASHLSYQSTAPDGQATHANRPGAHPGEVGSTGIYNLLLPLVLDSGSSASPNNAPVQFAAAAGPVFQPANAAVPAEMPSTGTLTGQIAQGQDQTQQLQLDGGQAAFISMIYSSGNLDLTLIDPNGIPVTPATVNPNIEFGSSEDDDGFKIEIYSITSAIAGLWTVKVHATSVTDPSGAEPYLINGWFPTSNLILTADTDKPAYEAGSSIFITANLQNGAVGVTGATVTGQVFSPTNVATDVTLFDNGTHGDVTAGDGIYSNSFTATNEPGSYKIVVNATGTVPTSFSRQDLAIVSVAEVTGSLNNSFTEDVDDTNGNGLNDELIIHAGVDISADGFFRFIGQLRDSEDHLIDETSFAGNLTTSDTSVDLIFDGSKIFENGVDGPYTLSLVRLGQDSGGVAVPVQELTGAYQTAAYDFASFEHASIVVTGINSEDPVDSDFNEKFDLLTITAGVELVDSGFYEWSGRLVDVNGFEVGFAGNSGFLDAGAGEIDFDFMGSTIGAHGVNGPYRLTDILINSSIESAVILQDFLTANYLASDFEGFNGSQPAKPTNLDLEDGSDTGRSDTDNFTGDNTPTITANAEPGNIVVFLINGNTISTTEISEGVYSATLASGVLQLGANSVTATSSNGSSVSPQSDALTIQLAVARTVNVAAGSSKALTQPDGTVVTTQLQGTSAVAVLTLLANDQLAEINTITINNAGKKAKKPALAVTATGGQGYVGQINNTTLLLDSLTLTKITVGQIQSAHDLGTLTFAGTSVLTGNLNVARNLLAVQAQQITLGTTINVGGNLGLLKLAGASAGSAINVQKKLANLEFHGDSNVSVRATKITLVTSNGIMRGSYTASSIDTIFSSGAFLAQLGATKVKHLNVPPS